MSQIRVYAHQTKTASQEFHLRRNVPKMLLPVFFFNSFQILFILCSKLLDDSVKGIEINLQNHLFLLCTNIHDKPSDQREGMGLLEYQVKISWRDIAHDGVLVFFVHSVIYQPQIGTSGVVRQGRRHGPSITYKITPC